MTKEHKNIAAIIPAAGASSRMGRLKPFLKFDEKRLFVDKIIEEYLEFGCEQVVVVYRKSELKWVSFMEKYSSNQKVIFVPNKHPELERFYSVKLGMEQLKTTDCCFLQNIDNPFINIDILEKLFFKVDDAEYLVPVYDTKGGHPVLLNRIIIDNIVSQPVDDMNLKELLANFERKNIEMENDLVLRNINTKDDYIKYFEGISK
jgi:molybdenum cofactor cytidylyltransferase